jgi:hypothetical protein
MNKRELKRALKAFAIRQLFLKPDMVYSFNLMNDIRTDRQKERVEEVILEIMKEWN